MRNTITWLKERLRLLFPYHQPNDYPLECFRDWTPYTIDLGPYFDTFAKSTASKTPDFSIFLWDGFGHMKRPIGCKQTPFRDCQYGFVLCRTGSWYEISIAGIGFTPLVGKEIIIGQIQGIAFSPAPVPSGTPPGDRQGFDETPRRLSGIGNTPGNRRQSETDRLRLDSDDRSRLHSHHRLAG